MVQSRRFARLLYSPLAHPDAARHSSRSDEREQVGVEDIRVCGQHAVGVARIGLQRAVLEQVDRARHCTFERNDLISLAMHYQHGYRDLPEIVGIVLEPGIDSQEVGEGTSGQRVLGDTLNFSVCPISEQVMAVPEHFARHFVSCCDCVVTKRYPTFSQA
jgi:hypothetical protein